MVATEWFSVEAFAIIYFACGVKNINTDLVNACPEGQSVRMCVCVYLLVCKEYADDQEGLRNASNIHVE